MAPIYCTFRPLFTLFVSLKDKKDQCKKEGRKKSGLWERKWEKRRLRAGDGPGIPQSGKRSVSELNAVSKQIGWWDWG